MRKTNKLFFDNGSLKIIANYKNGEIHKKQYTYFYGDSNLQKISTYKKGMLNGKIENYFTDGKIYTTAYYKNNELYNISLTHLFICLTKIFLIREKEQVSFFQQQNG